MTSNKLTQMVLVIATLTFIINHVHAESKEAIATVNGEEVNFQLFNEHLKVIQKKILSPRTTDQMKAQMRRQALRPMVKELLIKQALKKKGISVDPQLVTTKLKNIRKSYATPEKWSGYLERVRHTEVSHKRWLWESIALRALMQKAGLLVPTEADLKSLYEQIKTRFNTPEKVQLKQIMLLVQKGDSADKITQQKDLASKILKEVQSAKFPFEVYAARYNEDPVGNRGGDMGLIVRGQLPNELEAVAFNLKDGEISPVIESGFGLHILKRIRSVPASTKSLDELREWLTQRATDRLFRKGKRAFLKTLWDQATIHSQVELGSP